MLKLPKVFEVRWSQFSYTLLRNVLVSWSCLVYCFKESKEKDVGHFQFLTQEYRICFISFLSDVLLIFLRYQQQLQSDDLNLISMEEKTKQIIDKIDFR